MAMHAIMHVVHKVLKQLAVIAERRIACNLLIWGEEPYNYTESNNLG